MSIWKKKHTVEEINKQSEKTMSEHLGIEITELGDNFITGSMPVDWRTKQPFGILHGGASVVLAETLGSIAGNLAADENFADLCLSSRPSSQRRKLQQIFCLK